MSADLHMFIADLLHRRGIDDRDNFSRRSAKALSTLEVWSDRTIRQAISRVKTDLYRRNTSSTPDAVLDLLSSKLAEQWSSNPIAAMHNNTNVVKVLFIAANPVQTVAIHPGNNEPLTYKPLRLDHEYSEINRRIRASDNPDTLRLASCLAARPVDLIQSFNEEKPHIVHFSGHGTGKDLLLVDDLGEPSPVPTRLIESLFRVMKGRIKAVVLNACFSKAQAAAVRRHIDCTIGMSDTIGDEAAIAFSAAFYSAIGFGASVKAAFDQAILQLQLANIPEDRTPKLLPRKGVDPSSVKFFD